MMFNKSLETNAIYDAYIKKENSTIASTILIGNSYNVTIYCDHDMIIELDIVGTCIKKFVPLIKNDNVNIKKISF